MLKYRAQRLSIKRKHPFQPSSLVSAPLKSPCARQLIWFVFILYINVPDFLRLCYVYEINLYCCVKMLVVHAHYTIESIWMISWFLLLLIGLLWQFCSACLVVRARFPIYVCLGYTPGSRSAGSLCGYMFNLSGDCQALFSSVWRIWQLYIFTNYWYFLFLAF